MEIIDLVTYNGEAELFDLRYNILKDYVDQFIVVEAPTTFSGREKPLYFKDILDKYEKVIYFVVDENYTPEEIALAESSPNTIGAAHWQHEFLQKESIKKALIHLQDEDIVFIGDCDEIWDPTKGYALIPSKILLKVYTYYLNNRSNEVFKGTLVVQYKDIKNQCLNHLRTDTKTLQVGGWHFTSLSVHIKQKLLDSYTEETYASPRVMESLDENIRNNKDFLGRDFTYTLDESEWPEYLKANRETYSHLLKNEKGST